MTRKEDLIGRVIPYTITEHAFKPYVNGNREYICEKLSTQEGTIEVTEEDIRLGFFYEPYISQFNLSERVFKRYPFAHASVTFHWQ